MKVISGPASKELAEAVSAQTGYPNVPVVSKIFPDGESYVRLDGNVQGEEVAIVQTTCPPMQDGRLFQLAFMADSAKRAGAKKVTAVVPYLAYARQDKMFLSGEGISVETIARMLKAAGIDEFLTVNIHSEPTLAQFPFPAKTLSAIPLHRRLLREERPQRCIRALTRQRRHVHCPAGAGSFRRRCWAPQQNPRPLHRTNRPNR